MDFTQFCVHILSKDFDARNNEYEIHFSSRPRIQILHKAMTKMLEGSSSYCFAGEENIFCTPESLMNTFKILIM